MPEFDVYPSEHDELFGDMLDSLHECTCCTAPYRDRQPSPYQTAILRAVRHDNGSIIVVATAGSGKTTTLEMIANALPVSSSAVFLAFNKSIADELSRRLPFPASTFHALAFRALAKHIEQRLHHRPTVDAQKTSRILDTTYGDSIRSIHSVVVKLVSLLKGENIEPTDDNILALLDRHDISWDDPDYTYLDVAEAVRTSITISQADLSSVDFDDMLWLTVRLGIRLPTFDFVLVDEAQDTNPVQRAILRRLLSPTGRLIAVGDPSQAIYGFRGASSDALSLIASEFSCTTLPLTVSYRCARTICELAQRYGNIEPSPTAPDGTITYPSTLRYTDLLPDDMILCRNTAPLVQLAYALIGRRIPATIRGRDIGNGLKSLITRIAGKRTTLPALPDKLRAYRDKEVSEALSARQEAKAQAIDDKVSSILALIDSMTPADRALGIPGLLNVIDSMFSDKAEHGKIQLSTIHKSKGLEADHIIILDWSLLPSPYARQEWQQQQERNLQFVAVTRARQRLTFVSSDTFTD